MEKFNAVLFDLDGTLIDSAPGIYACFEHTFKQYGISVPRSELQSFLGPPLRDSFGKKLPKEEVERAVEIYRGHYSEVSGALTNPYAGVEAMLAELRKAGYTVCLATSKVRYAGLQILQELNLTKYFDYIGGASEDESMDTKTAVMRHVLSQPCMKGKNAVMIGDRDNDMQGAKDCRLPAIGICYGYAKEGELEKFSPVYMAKSPDDLCGWLLERYGN